MSRFICLVFMAAILIYPASAFSQTIYQTGSCSAKPYPVSNFATRGLQRFMGLNLLTSRIAESKIEGELKKLAKGDFDVSIKSYSAMDLLSGKIKNFRVTAKNVEFNDAHISYFEAGSLCDFIHIDYKKNLIVPLVPIFAEFKGTVTESDLNKTLSSDKIKEKFTRVKISLYSTDINLVDFLNPKVELKKDTIILSANLRFAGMFKFISVPVKIKTGLKVDGNKIRLYEPGLGSNPLLSGSVAFLADFLAMTSPVIFDFSTLKKDGIDITVKKLNIENGKININGTVWMPAKV